MPPRKGSANPRPCRQRIHLAPSDLLHRSKRPSRRAPRRPQTIADLAGPWSSTSAERRRPDRSAADPAPEPAGPSGSAGRLRRTTCRGSTARSIRSRRAEGRPRCRRPTAPFGGPEPCSGVRGHGRHPRAARWAQPGNHGRAPHRSTARVSGCGASGVVPTPGSESVRAGRGSAGSKGRSPGRTWARVSPSPFHIGRSASASGLLATGGAESDLARGGKPTQSRRRLAPSAASRRRPALLRRP